MDRQDLNELARLRVKPRTLTECTYTLQVFLDWAPDDIPQGPPEEMDEMVNEFAPFTYRERKGQGLGFVCKAKAGLEVYCPEYYEKLKRTEMSFKGWRKLMQHKPHQVCPESIAFLIVKSLIRMNEADSGVAVLLLYDN